MSFNKTFILILENSEKEYKLNLKIENDNFIHFRLSSTESPMEIYYIKLSLEELKLSNSLFNMFNSLNDCAENISKLINSKSYELSLNSEGASINIMIPILDKRIEINLIKDKSIKENPSYLKEELIKLKNKINDLEMKINQKDIIIENLIQKHDNDILDLRRMICNLHPEMSLILVNNIDKLLLANKFRQIYPGRNVNYSLLYRKSRDSDKSIMFHKNCDYIRGTVILIETQDNLRFGGFTNETWEGNNIAKNDNTAFLVSFNNNKIYDIKQNHCAIFCSQSYGPCFCGNNNNFSLFIHDNSDVNGGECCKQSDSNYNGFVMDYEINKGKKKFKIKEIEVFKVTIL